MNGWRSRIIVAVLMLLATNIHAFALAGKPNTDAGMALFHGSAAAVDFLLLWSAPRFISGRLCTDTQILCLVSCFANFLGFIAYQAYASPDYYNHFMWSLAYVQYGRILLVDHHGADYMVFDLDSRPDRGGRQNYIGAKSI